MARGGIRIPDHAAVISVRRSRSGELRITYPRRGRAAVAVLAAAGGAAAAACVLPGYGWSNPTGYAVAALLAAPALASIGWAFGPRAVLSTSGAELSVRYGPAFCERLVAVLPLETLEVRVATKLTEGVRYDEAAVRARVRAAIAPLASGRLATTEVKVHVLQVRNRGQADWLSVLGSQVVSEIEGARLALASAAGVAVVAELEDGKGEEQNGAKGGDK